jgi:hypothetical protein
MRPRWLIVAVAALVLAVGRTGSAHWEEVFHWSPGQIPMHLQMGGAPGPLVDGNGDWDAITMNALNAWNGVLAGVAFVPMPDPNHDAAMQDGANNVIFGDDVYGEPFGDGVLAITLTAYTTPDNVIVETDVVFNRKINWNSYHGDLRPAAGGGTLYDMGRVALHEFGHVLGLGHPDDHGQAVPAIMNSHTSNLDVLQQDDVDGVAAIYTATAAPIGATARLR